MLPGNVPEAEFPSGISILKVREYCNIHGLWQTK
ncbi:MAG: desulfoferrodoxin family protein [Caldisericia bacterium]|nr:desulfoferrodoxin family protein [Caldisericia bacterium]